MFTVYDLRCNGMREPRDVTGPLELSWRLSSDREGAVQRTLSVVVVSLASGDVVWETGEVHSPVPSVAYGGPELEAGTYCSWFVTVTDDAGEQAQSIPQAFCWGAPGSVAVSDAGPERRSFVQTSDDATNAELECAEDMDLRDRWWKDVLGVSVCGLHVHVAPQLPAGLSYARGAMLLSAGLLLVCVRRSEAQERVELTLPPSCTGTVVVGGVSHEVCSGHHVLPA